LAAPGIDVMIFKNIFVIKIGEKIGVFTQNKAKLRKILSYHWFLRKTPFFQKSQKIMIITSAPGIDVEKIIFRVLAFIILSMTFSNKAN
jgi:hypothetical protein